MAEIKKVPDHIVPFTSVSILQLVTGKTPTVPGVSNLWKRAPCATFGWNTTFAPKGINSLWKSSPECR
eukprot:11214769-Lingulodinium_polyedra.AAC.1